MTAAIPPRNARLKRRGRKEGRYDASSITSAHAHEDSLKICSWNGTTLERRGWSQRLCHVCCSPKAALNLSLDLSLKRGAGTDTKSVADSALQAARHQGNLRFLTTLTEHGVNPRCPRPHGTGEVCPG